MRSSALAGFLASAVLVSGSAGFASTFLVGPYLGEQALHQSPRATLMASAAPMDPLAVVVKVQPAKLEGDEVASQTAHHLRQVENTTTVRPAPAATTTASSEMPGPITEEAFAPTRPTTLPVSAGGPLIATEASSAMIAAKLENGEPVLTLRIAPFVAPTTPTADAADPDNAVEPTVISAPPSEQALTTTAAVMSTPAPAPAPEAEPVAPPPAPEPAAKPRKPALREAPAEATEPVRKPKPRTPARVTTTAPAAPPVEEHVPAALPPAPDPLNAPYTPSASPTLEETSPATHAPAPMGAPQQPQGESTGGPTPLTMPQ